MLLILTESTEFKPFIDAFSLPHTFKTAQQLIDERQIDRYRAGIHSLGDWTTTDSSSTHKDSFLQVLNVRSHKHTMRY